MNNLLVPPSPNWYESRILACSIDNTVVYGAMNDVVIINPVGKDEDADIRVLPPAHYGRIVSVDVNQNWSLGNKLVVSAGDDKLVHLWNAETYVLKCSNNKHTAQMDKLIGSVFMGTDKIISASEEGFVSLWRFNSVEITTFKNIFGCKVRVTTLSACPHVSWMVAFGLHCGLVVIADLRKTGRVVYKLRGHDKSVVSLSWCPTPFNIFPKKVFSKRPSKAPENMLTEKSVKSDEENTQEKINSESLEEFKAAEGEVKEAQTNDMECVIDQHKMETDQISQCAKVSKEESDIVESLSLQTEDIKSDSVLLETTYKPPIDLRENKSEYKIETDQTPFEYISETDPETHRSKELENLTQEVNENINLSDEKKLCEDSILPNTIEINKDPLIPSDELCEVENPVKEYLLASSARGGSIFIWRAGTDGRKETELVIGGSRSRRWKNADKGWISLCWITPDILLSSSPSAELLHWNLLDGLQKKLIHHDHNNNLFVIAAPIILTHNWKDNIRREDLHAWTTGQERYLLNTSLQADRTLLASYPAIGGNVYTIRGSPLDPTRLAIGIGDNTAKVWDLSRPHKQCITMANLWQKIQSKVLALAWHPKKETILAYATAEGRTGIVNTSTKNPTLLCQYFRNAVYDIQWGPIEGNQNNLGLYAVGEGKLVVYNTSKENEDPILIEPPTKEFIQIVSWKNDFSLMVCGTKTGSIIVYDINLKHVTTIYSEYKSVYCIVWHPLATSQDEETSPMASWLAISSSSTSVVIFDIPIDIINTEEKRKVAILSRHTKPVRCICWSPYVGGRIASGGDDGIIFVWDVQTQSVLATYVDHRLEPVLTVLWSPLDENFILSGGKDHCIRVWNITEHKPKSNEEITNALELYSLFRFEKKKLYKDTNPEADVDLPKVQRQVMMSLTSKAQNIPENILNDCARYFQIVNTSEGVNVESNGLVSEFDALKMFGDKNSMKELLDAEQKNHEEKKRTSCYQHLGLWKGDITEMVKTSIAQGNVSPWLINVAPMVSLELWKKACEVYAKKLMEDAKSDPIETVSYLLICHKVDEAIEVLCNATLFREALALAKCRLSKDDPTINEILKKWATFGILTGAYEISAQCFIALGQYDEASKALFRRTNIDALKFAVTLAEKTGNKDLIDACTTRYQNFKSSGEGDAICNEGPVQKVETKNSNLKEVLEAVENLAEVIEASTED